MAITLIKGRKLIDPDPKMVHDQLQGFQNLYRNHGSAYMVRYLLWILRKNPEDDSQQEVPSEQWNRRLVPFKYNRIQHDVERKLGKRNICNKPRQAGYCVKKDTPITLGNGRQTTYEKLRRKSQVLNEFGLPATIKEIFRIPDFLHEYKGQATEVHSTAAAEPITTAPNHPWLTQRGMVESQHLTSEDYLMHPRRKVGPSTMEWSRDLGVITGLTIGGAKILGKTAVQLDDATPKKKRFVEVHILPRICNILHGLQMHTSTTEKWIRNELRSRIDDRAWKFGKDFLIGVLEGWLVARGDWYSKSIDVETDNLEEANWIIQICLSLGLGMPHVSSKDGFTRLCFGKHCYNNIHGFLYNKVLEEKINRDGKRDQYVDENYVYVRVRKTVATKCEGFLDIEIDSESHLYWLPLGLTHNTTYFINRRLYLPAILEPGTGGLLISQKHSYATAHFGILQRVHRYVGCVDPMKPWKNLLHEQLQQNLLHLAYSNRKELIFDQLDSRIMVESAEVEEAGQGITLSHLVCTEVARWPGKPEETMANLKEAVAKDGTVDIESTPNGQGGYFFEEYNRAKRGGKDVEFTSHFHAWYWHDEYRISPPMLESELDEEERRKKALFLLDMEQMTWRRKKRVSLRHNFAEKYPEDDVSCFLSNARMFYDSEIAAARMTELMNYEPLTIERNGELRIFQNPIPGRRYVCGADPAEGKQVNNEESDWSAAGVIDEETGEQCASLRMKTSPENFALDLVELCEKYNQALLVIERNNHGATVILSVRETGYGNVYKHKEWTKRERSRGGKNQNVTKAAFQEWEGWPENVRTRKMMLNKSRDFLEHYPDLIWDVDLMSEVMTFVYDEKGVPKAIEGYHDDRVFGWALAHIGRLVQIGYVDPLTFKVRKYGESEDASDEENE